MFRGGLLLVTRRITSV